jgi:hypothetical protein
MIHFTIRKGSSGFILSVDFGLFTEIAQHYFSMSGCLLDVGYDVLGISLYFILDTVNQKIRLLSSKAQSG